MIVRSRAPLRLGLAGGGTDVSPYCDIYGGLVLNATIAKFAYTTISDTEDHGVFFHGLDVQKHAVLNHDDLNNKGGDLILHRSLYKVLVDRYPGIAGRNLKITTFCDAPVGSGLGSSSTLVVSMVRCFSEFFNLGLDDYQVAGLAFHVEREVCLLQGGRQDHYSASFGGFNYMEFYDGNRVVVNPLRIRPAVVCELEASLLLFYTGVSRESAKIISDQIDRMNSKTHTEDLSPFHAIKSEAVKMKECILKGDFDGVVESMRQGWFDKKRSAKSVSNHDIDEIYDSAINAGAAAGKISGAGGGGFMMFFVPPESRMSVIRRLKQFNGIVMNVEFFNYGSYAWKV